MDAYTRRDVLARLPILAGAAGAAGLVAAADAQDRHDHDHDHHHPQLPDKLVKVLSATHDGTGYTLPPLPYAHDAVEDAIDAETMRLHHERHHQSYVDGLNTAVTRMRDEGPTAEQALISGLKRDVTFNYGGHVNHAIFWATIGPCDDGPMGELRDDELRAALDRDFGSFDGFVSVFSKVAASVKGSGWSMLVFDPVSVGLRVIGMGDQDMGFTPGTMPLLPLDVWEHAYYLRYQNRRAEYIENFFKVIDWECVAGLYRMVSAPYRRG